MTLKRQFFFSFFLLASLALLSALLLFAPQWNAYAQHCLDCGGGGGGAPPPTEPPGGGGGGGGGGSTPEPPPGPPDPPEPPCEPFFSPPVISPNLTLDPPYPITLGQDPQKRGVQVSGVLAIAGARTCPPGRAQIVSLRVAQVRLADSSIAWITGTLAHKYPGAHVKGTYPFTPSYQISGVGSPVARLSFQLYPLDPGYYEVVVQASQSDGQSTTALLRVPIYLLESSIIE